MNAFYQITYDRVTISFSGNIEQTVNWSGDVVVNVLPENLPSIKAGSPSARGFLLDVSSGTNFASIRVTNTREVSVNSNSNSIASGHYIEGTVEYIY